MKEGPRTGVTHHLQSQPSPRKISSGSGEAAAQGEDDDVDFSEFLPDFQRVNISGEDNTGVWYARGDDLLSLLQLLQVPVEDLQSASHLLARALNIREKYLVTSHQEIPTDVQRFVIINTS